MELYSFRILNASADPGFCQGVGLLSCRCSEVKSPEQSNLFELGSRDCLRGLEAFFNAQIYAFYHSGDSFPLISDT